MGKIDKGAKCTVTSCGQDAVRSISMEKITEAGLSVSSGRRGYLCKSHYKELKKRLRRDKKLEKWRMMA